MDYLLNVLRFALNDTAYFSKRENSNASTCASQCFPRPFGETLDSFGSIIIWFEGNSIHGASAVCSAGRERGSAKLYEEMQLIGSAVLSGADDLSQSAGHRILLVDDNLELISSVATLVELWGHRVQIAHNGVEALQVAKNFAPDVIVLDIGLPQMDGYEVLRRLRENGSLDGVFAIAMTGYGQDSDKQAISSAGFDAHLVKPVQPSVLKQLLVQLRARR